MIYLYEYTRREFFSCAFFWSVLQRILIETILGDKNELFKIDHF